MTVDEQHIRRAIRLAMNGRGRVEPNPMVGCVLVKDGRVIGEGFHGHYGGPHAEPTALASCTVPAAGATAYVTLEPCCHTNKQTPPCAPRLIRDGIARVVIGCLDPNPDVNGKGVRMLREAGIHVDGPVLEAECKQLIAPFLARVTLARPYVTLKWAESADGKVAGAHGTRRKISGPMSDRLIHILRSRSDAIAVGGQTLRTDDPLLTARDVECSRKPATRVVLSPSLDVPLIRRLFQTPSAGPVTVYTSQWEAIGRDPKIELLAASGVKVIPVPSTIRERLSLATVLTHLATRGATTHLLIEAGPNLSKAVFEQAVADRLWVIQSPTPIADDTAPSAAAVPEGYVPVGRLDLDGDVLTEYLNTRSAAYFAAVPSADFVLAGTPIVQEPNLAPGEDARG